MEKRSEDVHNTFEIRAAILNADRVLGRAGTVIRVQYLVSLGATPAPFCVQYCPPVFREFITKLISLSLLRFAAQRTLLVILNRS